ncbi:MAG: hydantoinase/oxoprolinase family protein, partial [Actinobacteria bacterium]|nr:hydantoinase/oxoprolinase family protein [Actinomycetota bacterium]
RRLARHLPGQLWIVQSNGGVLRAAEAAARPVRTVLSGPAAGVTGASLVAGASGYAQIVTLDMGGTSTDVAVCPGAPLRTTQATVADLPIAMPIIDIHTVGAGGGSIAFLDDAGALRVGPRSAGADPGPACYNRGGVEPTVTDANLTLGRLSGSTRLAGTLALDATLAARALDRLLSPRRRSEAARREAAAAVVAVANAHMERALRVITLERGYDPRAFALVAFGGAGPLHACELAERLEIGTVVVPRFPGVLSALGALAGAHLREYTATLLKPVATLSDARLGRVIGRLAAMAARDFGASATPVLQPLLDLRYVGQSYELTVPLDASGLAGAVQAFHRRHAQRYAHSRPEAPVEVVVARLVASVPQPPVPLPRLSRSRRAAAPASAREAVVGARVRSVPVYDRSHLRAGQTFDGPAVIEQPDATTWLPLGWSAAVDAHAALILRRNPTGQGADGHTTIRPRVRIRALATNRGRARQAPLRRGARRRHTIES